MKKIQYDKFGQQDPPIFILSTVWHHHLGTITNIDSSTINEKWNMNSADEISFDVYKNVDGTDCELWDSLKSFKYVYVPSHDAYYKIDVAIDESNKTVKHITGTAAGEFELSNRIIVDLQINTNVDIEERDQDESDGVDGVIFYNPQKPEFSLLDLVLKDKAPDWTIAHVDTSLCNVQRTYTFSNQTIYDALTNTIATETQCLFTFDSVNRTISAYDLLNYCNATVTDSHGNQHVCGYRTEYNTCPKCGNTHLVPSYGTNTHIYISPENFAESITIDGNESNVKNCFKISGGDENMTAAVINCNPAGSAYIYDFSEDDYADMPQELVDKLNQYYEDYEAAKPSREEKATELYNAWTQYYYYRDNMMPRASADHWQADYEGYNVNDTCYVITLPSSYHLKCVRVEGEGKTGHIEFDATEAIEGDQYVDNDITWEVVMNTVGDLPTAEQVLHDAERFITDVNHKVFYEDTPVSDASVRLAIKNLIAANINPLFNVDLSDGTVSPDQAHRTSGTSVITWTGKLTIVNTTKQDDVRTSSTDQTATLKKASSVQEHEQYMYDLTKKRLDRADTAFTDLYALPIPYKTVGGKEVYDEDADIDFRALVKEYSLNLLDGFYKSYTACREVLITNGVTESTPTFHGADLYQKFYIPYNKRMEYIDAEMKVRQEQVYSLYIDPKEPNYDPNNKPIINQIKDWMDAQNAIFNLRTYLGEDLYAIFCHYRKESAYQNSNYISTGLSDNVLILRARELFDKATEELAKAKELQISLSTSLGNLLNTKEFENYKDKFEIGDYLMCRADDVLYKIRLMEVDISYNDPKSINVTFSNITKSKTFMSDVQDVLSQAKSISSSYTSTTRQVEQNSRAASTVYDWTKEGLSSALVKIMNNNHEEITYDENGIIARQYNDVEDKYDPYQLRITHDQIIFTADNWNSGSLALGNNEYKYIDENTHNLATSQGYGLISKFVNSAYIYSSQIIAGHIYSDNYLTSNGDIIDGSHFDLDNGTFELAGGKLKAVYNSTTNVYGVELDGTIKATNGEIGGWTIDSDKLYKHVDTSNPPYNTRWYETTLQPSDINFKSYDSVDDGYHELNIAPTGIIARTGGDVDNLDIIFELNFVQTGLQVIDVNKMLVGGSPTQWGGTINGFNYSLDETLKGILSEGYNRGTYIDNRFIGVTGIVTNQVLNIWIPLKINPIGATISISSCKIYWNSSIWGTESVSHIDETYDVDYKKQGMIALQFDTNFGVADYTPFVGFVDLSFTIT